MSEFDYRATGLDEKCAKCKHADKSAFSEPCVECGFNYSRFEQKEVKSNIKAGGKIGTTDLEKVIKGLECCMVPYEDLCANCPYNDPTTYEYGETNCLRKELMPDALVLLKKQEKEIKALRLLVEWAEECDFGFDQFPDEYERYKDEIKDMKYIDGMIHIAKRTLEDHEAFKEGR